MNDPAIESPARRLTANGRILAAFLNEATAQALREFQNAAPEFQDRIRGKFGSTEIQHPLQRPVVPAFRHVDEPEVIDFLASIAQCGGPTTLSNLVGFEWVEIDSILAGHYVAAPLAPDGRTPEAHSTVLQIAQYCFVGNSLALQQDLVPLPAGDIISPEVLQTQLTGIQFTHKGSIIAEYSVFRPPSAITLLYVDDSVVAVKHLERLVALAKAGIKEALCLVAYGYGTEIISTLPSIDDQLLASSHPPRITDFCSDALSVEIPVHTPRILLRFSQQTIPLTLPT